MSTLDQVHCIECGWTGTETDLDNSHGGPQCPECGEPVRRQSVSEIHAGRPETLSKAKTWPLLAAMNRSRAGSNRLWKAPSPVASCASKDAPKPQVGP